LARRKQGWSKIAKERDERKERLITIVGPTAVGKSRVAFRQAQLLDTEIITADSMQIYKGMDIGTDKPKQEEREAVKHHLVDEVDVSKEYSVATYQKRARSIISDINEQDKLPILVGGTGLYVRAVIDRLIFSPETAPSQIRENLARESLGGSLLRQAQAFGSEVFDREAQTESAQARRDGELCRTIFEELASLDPEAAEKIGPGNTRRVIRALEVIKVTGKPFSSFQGEWPKRDSIYDLLFFGLTLPREELYQRIEERVDSMLSAGLLEETRTLLRSGGLSLTAKQALGYRQIVEYLEGKRNWEETVALIKTKTRQYAKRQLTWFRADPRIVWIDLTQDEPVSFICQKVKERWGIVCRG